MADSSGMPDHELLAAVAAGDTCAFERLYERFERRAFQYALSIVRDRSVAEEILVDTMTSVWDGASRFGGRSQVSTWILGIARHKALDALGRGPKVEAVPLEESEELPDDRESAAELLDRHGAATRMREALATLSQDHREILRLAFFEELHYEEIARLLDIPVNTVKTRVYYAKQQLKNRLEDPAERERG
jgi:RNA polymerase sigma-70 factor (ECF subfamily)